MEVILQGTALVVLVQHQHACDSALPKFSSLNLTFIAKFLVPGPVPSLLCLITSFQTVVHCQGMWGGVMAQVVSHLSHPGYHMHHHDLLYTKIPCKLVVLHLDPDNQCRSGVGMQQSLC